MSRHLYLLCLALPVLVTCTGCDLTQLSQDAQTAVATFQQDKSVVENLVADVKRSFTPDAPEYQAAEAKYFQARRSYDAYLGQINLAATTGDRSINAGDSQQSATDAMNSFVRSAAVSLAPGDRSLAAIALAGLPSIYKLLTGLPKNRKAEVTRGLIDHVQWRAWDAISSDREETATKRSRRTKHATDDQQEDSRRVTP
jgi:hypothetical protein